MLIQSVHRRNQCHAPEGPSIVEYRCWMQVRAGASAMGCARMMHYPGRNNSVSDHPGDFWGRSAGDRGRRRGRGASGNEPKCGFCPRLCDIVLLSVTWSSPCCALLTKIGVMSAEALGIEWRYTVIRVVRAFSENVAVKMTPHLTANGIVSGTAHLLTMRGKRLTVCRLDGHPNVLRSYLVGNVSLEPMSNREVRCRVL